MENLSGSHNSSRTAILSGMKGVVQEDNVNSGEREGEKDKTAEIKFQKLMEAHIKVRREYAKLIRQRYDRSSGAADSNVLDEVKKVMDILYHRLQPQFVPSMSYDGLQIRHIIMATIRDVTLKLNSTSDQPNNAAHGTTSEHSVDPAHVTEYTSHHLTVVHSSQDTVYQGEGSLFS